MVLIFLLSQGECVSDLLDSLMVDLLIFVSLAGTPCEVFILFIYILGFDSS